ncbi:MAG: hypothetical protein U9N86_13520 [Bacteroidota bacterium]|nr:hypothetical protein [Bacteroidota bacterium]
MILIHLRMLFSNKRQTKIFHPRRAISISSLEVAYAKNGGTIHDTSFEGRRAEHKRNKQENRALQRDHQEIYL